MFIVEQEENLLRTVTSFNPPVEAGGHIIDTENGKVITTTGGVLLGKMSFQMTAQKFDTSWFSLVGGYEPVNGIDINIDGTKYYNDTSTFRFTDQTASDDATLSNLILSTGEIDEENPDNSTYKEYGLTPTFDKETLIYEVTLLEYIDTMDITATQNHEKATMKIIVPKRDETGNLVYDTDGSTIIYEEKDLTNDTPTAFTLNKLGEPDTIIKVKVTAEDTVTTQEYEITIKRPYGTITGQISTYNTNDIHKATVKIYKTGDITWEDYYISYNDVYTHEDLPEPLDYIETAEDGTFSIKVIPGTYDIMIDKECYFDYITTNHQILEGETKNLNTIELTPGDVNKDGIIDAKDFNNIKLYFGQEHLATDVDESGTVDAPDFNAVKLRFGQEIEIF